MWLLDRFFKMTDKSTDHNGVADPKPLSLPPYNLLDRHFRLSDGVEVKIIGFQYGGKFHVPFLLRSRIVQTGELLLIDPDYVRRFDDITPSHAKQEALRKPFVPRSQEEEVTRVIGWTSRTKLGRDNQPFTQLIRIADQDRGEGGPQP